MQTYFSLEPIIIATFAGFVFGFIWYSPFLFMKTWLWSQGFTETNTPKHDKQYMFSIGLYSFIAHGCIAAVLALLFDILSVSTLQLAYQLALLLALGFIVPVKFMEMIYSLHGKHYEKKQQYRFLIDSSYFAITLMIMGVSFYFFAK